MSAESLQRVSVNLQSLTESIQLKPNLSLLFVQVSATDFWTFSVISFECLSVLLSLP